MDGVISPMEDMMVYCALKDTDAVPNIPALVQASFELWRMLCQKDAGQRGGSTSINWEESYARIHMDMIYHAIVLSHHLADFLYPDDQWFAMWGPDIQEDQLKPARKSELGRLKLLGGLPVDPDVLHGLVDILRTNDSLKARNNVISEALCIALSGRLKGGAQILWTP